MQVKILLFVHSSLDAFFSCTFNFLNRQNPHSFKKKNCICRLDIKLEYFLGNSGCSRVLQKASAFETQATILPTTS